MRKHGETWGTNLPLFLPKGSRLIRTRCWMFNSLLFSLAAQTEMKRWRVAGAGLSGLFIRYYNLRFLRGQGQRWLLFARYFMARKIIDPRGVHLVHMEVFRRERPFVARDAAQPINKGQTRTVRTGCKGRQEPTFPFFLPNREIRSDWVQICRPRRACDNLMSFQGLGDQ